MKHTYCILVLNTHSLHFPQVDELAALREAALDSARERKLSSDILGKRRQGSVEGLGKRRLESPPSHHYDIMRGPGTCLVISCLCMIFILSSTS